MKHINSIKESINYSLLIPYFIWQNKGENFVKSKRYDVGISGFNFSDTLLLISSKNDAL